MCTVSYVKHSDGFSLTSNRDEVSFRPTQPPQIYNESEQYLAYPKDEIAGGTWIATSSRNISVCLLNGAFENHKRNLPYNRSRGQVLKERFNFKTHLDFAERVDLDNVEPFMLLMLDHQNISDIDFKILVWDGHKKHILRVDMNKPQIWASSTLYNQNQRKRRTEWFKDFLKNNDDPDRRSLMTFHTGSYTTHKEEDMVMERNDDLKTVSVSQIHISADHSNFLYKDMEKNKDYILNLDSLSS
jgi:uncharacterized protein with NRDE domain